jgi:hypothetical protein
VAFPNKCSPNSEHRELLFQECLSSRPLPNTKHRQEINLKILSHYAQWISWGKKKLKRGEAVEN